MRPCDGALFVGGKCEGDCPVDIGRIDDLLARVFAACSVFAKSGRFEPQRSVSAHVKTASSSPPRVDDIKKGNVALHGSAEDRPMVPDRTVCAGQGYYRGAVTTIRISLAEPARGNRTRVRPLARNSVSRCSGRRVETARVVVHRP
jgi:hypothetical protein